MTVPPVFERPTAFNPDPSADGVTLVLGAPHRGKAERFEALDDENSVSHVEALADVDAKADAPVVVDDFYTAYRQADADDRVQLGV